MMASYLGDMTSTKSSQSCILFDVSVPSAVVHILQRIVMWNGHPTISREFSETDKASSLDVIAVVQSSTSGIIATGMIAEQNISVAAGFDHLSLTLDMSVDKRTVQPASSNEFVFSYILEDVATEFLQGSLTVEWRHNMAQIGHLGPEYMAATCIALARNGEQLAAIGQKWKQHSSGLTQTIVSDILRLTEIQPIVDPLSTIQPSYLIQSGIPQKLRTDTTFRFLFHLRNCLWYLNSEGRSVPQSVQGDTTYIADLNAFIYLLEARLLALDQDAYDITQWSSLQPLFPGLQGTEDSLTPLHPSHPALSSLSIRFCKISIVILDPSHNSHSELTITDVHLSVRMRSVEALQISTHPTSMSQTSFKEKRSQSVLKTSASILLGDITLTVFPHLMKFAQLILRVRRHYHTASPTGIVSTPPVAGSDISPQVSSTDITYSLHHLQIQAGAENLVFEFGLSGVRGASSVLLRARDPCSQSMNHSILFKKTYIQARSPADMAKQSDQDILASIDITNGKVNTISRTNISSRSNINLVFSIGGFKFNVPRSALRLYRFIEEWRADFLPGIEATMQALLSELQRAPMKPLSPTTSLSSRHPILQIQGQMSCFGISLQVMHGTWLTWEASDSTAYFYSSNVPSFSPAYTFGLQVASIILSISSKPNARDVPSSTRVKLVLPPLSATGHYDGSCIHVLSLIEFVELKVKPSHWDALLAVQQKFGQDFNDLVALVQETNFRRTTSPPKKAPHHPGKKLKYHGFLKIRGFRVGLEGLSSTVYLECQDIGGGVNNTAGLAWDIGLSDLAFSLAPRAVIGPQYPGFNRNHRSAFVIIDFNVSADNRTIEASTNTVVQIAVTKIHAVMQPSSIGEVGDFIDYLQVMYELYQ
jgi:hypothetical protein